MPSARDWLETERLLVEMELVAAGSEEARRRYPGLPWIGDELVVVSDTGDVWHDGPAFLMCLWATRQYRPLSHRLSGPAFKPMATRFFESISKRRSAVGRLLRREEDCESCAR